MKVLVVRVAAFIASEKVAVGETLTATPVAPGAGVRAVIVGGVVSPPPPLPHSILCFGPVGVVVVVLFAAVGDHEPELGSAGDRDVDGLVAVAPVIAPES